MSSLDRAKAATEKARAVPGFGGATFSIFDTDTGTVTGVSMSVPSFEALVNAAIDANVRLDFSRMPVPELSKLVDRMREGALAERADRSTGRFIELSSGTAGGIVRIKAEDIDAYGSAPSGGRQEAWVGVGGRTFSVRESLEELRNLIEGPE